MCGIIGYTGPKRAVDILLKGLKRLEYRGYDSAGVAVQGPRGFIIRKNAGKIEALERVVDPADFPGITGIGHTRWATHGAPNQRNAHPHLSTTKRIVLVHNGIIENYAELRDRLTKKGVKFSSDTDTETLVHLIDMQYAGDLAAAVRSALRDVRGTYAIAVMSSDEPDVIVAARLFSPLIVALGSGENFLASDTPAILEYTNRVIFLADGDVAKITPERVTITDLSGRPLDRKAARVSYDIERAEKRGYDHFMLKEIHEQPEAVRETIQGRITKTGVVFEDFAVGDPFLKRVDRVVIVACGTAYHAGLVGKYLLNDLARMPVLADQASEFRYSPPPITKNTLALAITQSGETADTLAGVREAKRLGATVLTVCNVMGSSIPRVSDGVIYTRAGPEIGVASTKAYTTQLCVLVMLAVKMGMLRGTLSRAGARGILSALQEIPEKMQGVLSDERVIRRCAAKFKDAQTFLYLGRRYNYPTAYEGALKLKEISYIHAEGYGAGEMKHGPIALVQPDYPTLAIAPKDSVHEKMLSNIQEVRARRGPVIAVGTAGDEALRKIADHVLWIPETLEPLSPMLAVVPLQLLAYHIAVLRGCDVDKPRNLAKSVTVE
jgi:glucosamine--fructose-6-phosphate aminotransferase (isomerizing)